MKKLRAWFKSLIVLWAVVFWCVVLWPTEKEKVFKIAYIGKDKNGISQVFLINSDGTGKKILTNTPFEKWNPSLSHDGKTVVFQVLMRDWDIYSIDVEGKNLKKLALSLAQEVSPCFTPDDKKIIFISTQEGDIMKLFVMNRDGSNQKKLFDFIAATPSCSR